MPCVHQIKILFLVVVTVFILLSQTVLQVHLNYDERNMNMKVSSDTKDSNENSQSSSSIHPIDSDSDGNRMKRSLFKSDVISSKEESDNSLTATLAKPTVSPAPSPTLTTSASIINYAPPDPLSTVGDLQANLKKQPGKHVTDWSEIPDNLFLRNYYTGNFSIVNSDLCVRKPNLTLVILITSAIDHFQQRNNVRQTWGHYGLRADVQFAFVIGDSLLHTYNESVREALQKEIDLYDDFVIACFEDTYRNLTLKTLHMMDWVSTYCTSAKYFVKTDDDVFINIPGILKHIENVKAEDEIEPKIYGHIFSGHLASRNTSHKHYVHYDVYPYLLPYPNFTSGPAYLMSVTVVRPLFLEGLKLPFIPLEDVLITGFSAMNLGIARVDMPQFINEVGDISALSACKLITVFAGMTDGSAVKMNYIWFNYMMGRTICIWKTRSR